MASSSTRSIHYVVRLWYELGICHQTLKRVRHVLTISLLRSQNGKSRWMKTGYTAVAEWWWWQKPKHLEKNLSQCYPCSPQIPHGLAWNQTQASVAKLHHCMHTILTCKREWHSANGCQIHLVGNPDSNEHIMFSACLLFSNDHAQDDCYWSLTNPLGHTSSTTPMIQRWWCGVVCLVTWLWIHTSSQGMWTKRDMGRQSAYLHYFKNGIFFLICQVTFALQNSW